MRQGAGGGRQRDAERRSDPVSGIHHVEVHGLRDPRPHHSAAAHPQHQHGSGGEGGGPRQRPRLGGGRLPPRGRRRQQKQEGGEQGGQRPQRGADLPPRLHRRAPHVGGGDPCGGGHRREDALHNGERRQVTRCAPWSACVQRLQGEHAVVCYKMRDPNCENWAAGFSWGHTNCGNTVNTTPVGCVCGERCICVNPGLRWRDVAARFFF